MNSSESIIDKYKGLEAFLDGIFKKSWLAKALSIAGLKKWHYGVVLRGLSESTLLILSELQNDSSWEWMNSLKYTIRHTTGITISFDNKGAHIHEYQGIFPAKERAWIYMACELQVERKLAAEREVRDWGLKVTHHSKVEDFNNKLRGKDDATITDIQ
jgi:hypothetical protein